MSEQITINAMQLRDAAARQIVTVSQAEQLWQYLLQAHHAHKSRAGGTADNSAAGLSAAPPQGSSGEPSFGFGHVMYYFGGLIAIGALSLFTTLGFSQMGFGFLLTVALGYCVLFVSLTEYLQQRRLAIPAGIMGALAVSMIPMAVFALQNLLGYWPDEVSSNYRDYHHYIDWRWIIMELATLVGAAALLYRYRLPFMTMPLAVTGWYMCMDVASILATSDASDYAIRRTCLIVGGLIMVVISLLIDRRTHRRPDFGFWFCLFGTFSFWSGVCWSHSDVWWHRHAFAALCVAMIFGGALLQRRVFTIVGAMSFSGYLGWLSYDLFETSLLFPIVLSGIGLGIVAFGIWWHKREREISARFSGFLPDWLQFAR